MPTSLAQTDTAAGQARWKSHEESPLTRETFEALCAFEIPCLRIKGFATDAECDELVAAMDRVGLNKTYKVPGLVQTAEICRPDPVRKTPGIERGVFCRG